MAVWPLKVIEEGSFIFPPRTIQTSSIPVVLYFSADFLWRIVYIHFKHDNVFYQL